MTKKAIAAAILASTLLMLITAGACSGDGERVEDAVVQRVGSLGPDTLAAHQGCVTVTVKDSLNQPVANAAITGVPTTYDGISPEVMTDANGVACVQTLRREGVNEDLDGDGALGEQHQVALRIIVNGALYDGGTHTTSAAQVACGGACVTANVTLGAALQPALCTIKGKVYQAGQSPTPLAGKTVTVRDVSVSPSLFLSQCAPPATCSAITQSAANGDYELKVPVRDNLRNLMVVAGGTVDVSANQVDWYGASTLQSGCPQGDLDLYLDVQATEKKVTTSLSGSTISWMPNEEVDSIMVTDSAGVVKWHVAAAPGADPVGSPVAYGSVPTGWCRVFTPGGIVPIPGENDVVFVTGSFVDDELEQKIRDDHGWAPPYEQQHRCLAGRPLIENRGGDNPPGWHVFYNQGGTVQSAFARRDDNNQIKQLHNWGKPDDALASQGAGFSPGSSNSYWSSFEGKFWSVNAGNRTCNNNPAVWTEYARPAPPPLIGPSWSTPERLASNPDGYVVTGAGLTSMYSPAAGWTSVLSGLVPFGNPGDGVATYANGQDWRVFVPAGPRSILEVVFDTTQAAWVVVGPIGDRVELVFQGRPELLEGLAIVSSTAGNALHMLDRQSARDGWIQIGEAGTSDHAPSQGVSGIAFATDAGATRKIRTREYQAVATLGGPNRIKFIGNGWTQRPSPVDVGDIRSRPTAVLDNLGLVNGGRRSFVIVLKQVLGRDDEEHFYELKESNGALSWLDWGPLPGTCLH